MEIQQIHRKIYTVRDFKVMLDFDLAQLYNVQTKNLNLAVKRNFKRFPDDFMFQLNKEEWDNLRLQIATSSEHGGNRYLPYAFTEQGLAMLSGVLNSDIAIEVHINIMRVFVMLREFSLTQIEIQKKLYELESKYDQKFKNVYEALTFLINKDKIKEERSNRKQIGFDLPPSTGE